MQLQFLVTERLHYTIGTLHYNWSMSTHTSQALASLPNRYSGRAVGLWRMRWHARSAQLIQYSAVYRFGSLSQAFSTTSVPIV